MRDYFDRLSKEFGRALQHQSHQMYQRAYFQKGICANTQKNAHEEKSIILLALLIMTSRHGSDFEKLLDPVAKSQQQNNSISRQSH